VVKRVNRGDQSPLLRYEGDKGVFHKFDELSERITDGQIKKRRGNRSEGRGPNYEKSEKSSSSFTIPSNSSKL
jgi:hypothetical protein